VNYFDKTCKYACFKIFYSLPISLKCFSFTKLFWKYESGRGNDMCKSLEAETFPMRKWGRLAFALKASPRWASLKICPQLPLRPG
jgi:hypothetical protein